MRTKLVKRKPSKRGRKPLGLDGHIRRAMFAQEVRDEMERRESAGKRKSITKAVAAAVEKFGYTGIKPETLRKEWNAAKRLRDHNLAINSYWDALFNCQK